VGVFRDAPSTDQRWQDGLAHKISHSRDSTKCKKAWTTARVSSEDSRAHPARNFERRKLHPFMGRSSRSVRGRSRQRSRRRRQQVRDHEPIARARPPLHPRRGAEEFPRNATEDGAGGQSAISPPCFSPAVSPSGWGSQGGRRHGRAPARP
jgi:hypothetical protein